MPEPIPDPSTAHAHHRHRTVAEWDRIANSAEFRALIRTKLRFIIPATIFFIIYYFALPVLVGYFPAVMETKVIGSVNWAYLFALSQFFMAWIIMGLYICHARKFDRMEHRLIEQIHRGAHGERGDG